MTFRLSFSVYPGSNYSLIILCDGRLKQNSKVFLEEHFLKRHETAVVDELDRSVRNKCVNWVWAWLGCQDANEDSLQVSINDLRDYFPKAAFNFLVLQFHHLMKRER